ncbi:glycosyltransferase [Streptosporangium fragile]|uniref:Glycosyltransferase n=1 Tax=Streptosporangium fragile TaxID=46186 RepID=A0ABP6IL71_9ACTN
MEGSATAAGGRAQVRSVAFLIGHLGMGGTQRQLSLLARELRGRGVEVHVLLLSKDGPHEPELRAAGVGVHHLGFTRRPPRPRAAAENARAFARLVGLLRRLRPDVLHAFLREGYVLGAPAARLAGVPVTVAGRRNQSRLERRRRWLRPLEGALNLIVDHVAVNAAALAEDAHTADGVPTRKLSVIYNGLPAPAFDPVEPEQVDTAFPVVVCVARLSPEKGHRVLVEAAADLARRGRPCTFVLVGDGPERGRLEGRVDASGADVRFAGVRGDVRGFLARADVVVLPSLSEGLSNAVMEAMAAGRPVVATAVGGTAELLGDRGILVPAADPQALADGIARLLDDPVLAASLADAALAWARKNLGLDVMVDAHLALYGRLLEARRAR